MLQDFVTTRLSAEEVGDLLTMAGFELEGIDEVNGHPVLDLKVMSNRGDGLSALGLAREILAKSDESQRTELYLRATQRFSDVPFPPALANSNRVTVESDNGIRYVGTVIEDVKNGSSPQWIQDRLEHAGMRPISLLVDLTNYVMLETGQPLHVFDLDKLSGEKVIVRESKEGEKLTTLNEVEHHLSAGLLVIADSEKPVAVAGVMGGLPSEVTADSTRVLLESANFAPRAVRKTRKALGLNTEGSYRHERSTDPDGTLGVARRFVELLRQSSPEAQVSEVVDQYPGKVARSVISVRVDRASKLLGMPIHSSEAKSYLERLGMEVGGHGDPYQVVTPSWRPDLVREEDLIEELGRVHGYDQIPEWLPEGTSNIGGSAGRHLKVDQLQESILRLGYSQVISHSLRDLHPLDTSSERVGPRQPGSPDMAWLRNSLWPSLSDAVRRNEAKDLHIFEVGKVFGRTATRTCEDLSFGVLSVGAIYPLNRQGRPGAQADFYTLKGAVQAALASVGVIVDVIPCSDDAVDPRLHPTRQGQIVIAGALVGLMGQIHPDVANRTDLPAGTVLAEIDLGKALKSEAPLLIKPISRNPAVRRDIALLISKDVPYALVNEAIVRSAGDVLERHWLFDVYTGANLPEGQHSLGIALQLRKHGENFTDEQANQVRETVVAELKTLGGSTR